MRSPGQAVESLAAHPLQTCLALLGVFVSIFTPLVLVALVEGVAHQAERLLTLELGTDLLWIQERERSSARREKQEQRSIRVLHAEAAALGRCSLVSEVAPIVLLQVRLRNGRVSTPAVSVLGCTASTFALLQRSFASGRAWSTEEGKRRRRVAVLTWSLAEELFPANDPLGGSILLDGQLYTVVGVLGNVGSRPGAPNDVQLFVPLSSIPDRSPSAITRSIMVRGGASVPESCVQEQIEAALRHQRRIPVDGDNDFEIVSARAKRRILHRWTRRVESSLACCAGITLVVGGLGVLNVLLTSVGQRRCEIGVRRAVGARAGEIHMQFLMESLLVNLTGAVLAVTASQLLMGLIRFLSPLEPALAPGTLLSTIVVSLLVGWGSGGLPAHRAAAVQVSEALRSV